MLSRSGVEPPTGTIHPRESRGIDDRKWESIKKVVVEGDFPDLEIVERHLAGVDRSGRGCNPRPAQDRLIVVEGDFPDLEIVEKHLAGVDRSGRGCNPRPASNRHQDRINFLALLFRR